MFDYSLTHWLTFAAAGLALEFTPGPSMLYVLGQTARHGRGRGLVSLAGIFSGGFVYVAASVFGLAALIAHSPVLFSIIKWAGGAYLVWLGMQSLRAAADKTSVSHSNHDSAARDGGAWRAYRQGLLIDLLNPKVALFFVAFLPQFVVPGAGSVKSQLALHAFALMALAITCDVPLVLIGARLVRWFKGRKGLGRWSERGLGVVFIALGARLAFLHH